MWNGFASCKLKAGGLLTCLLACLLPRVVGLKAVTRGDYSTIRGASEATNNTTAPQPYKKQTLPKPAAAAKGNRFFCACFSLNEIKDSGVHWVDTQRHARANFGKLLAFFLPFFLFDLFRLGLATSQGLCKWHTGDAAVLAAAHLLAVEYWACPLLSLMNVVASMVFCTRSLHLTGRPLTRTSKEKEWPGNDRRERYYLGGNEN